VITFTTWTLLYALTQHSSVFANDCLYSTKINHGGHWSSQRLIWFTSILYALYDIRWFIWRYGFSTGRFSMLYCPRNEYSEKHL